MFKNRLKIFFHPLFVFVMVQVAWLTLLGLWIYWFTSNYIILKQVGQRIAPQMVNTGSQIFALISGLVLLVVVLVGIYFVFIYLTRQINITRLYESFIANFTHELKSPLASLQLYLETLRMRQVPPEKQRMFIDIMLKDTRRLKNLIDSILNISQIEQNKMVYHFRVVVADQFVRRAVAECREKFNLPEDAITITGSAPYEWVVDEEAMMTVFSNLVDNAIKYTPGQFHLTVEMSCTEKNILIRFIDRGIGIEPHDLPRVFDKFYRVHSREVPDIRGTGLGLYMVQEIVRQHGGTVSVHSDGRNKGSTFILEFPIYGRSRTRLLKRLLQQSESSEEAEHESV
jgi:signal transduction histidine kinase